MSDKKGMTKEDAKKMVDDIMGEGWWDSQPAMVREGLAHGLAGIEAKPLEEDENEDWELEVVYCMNEMRKALERVSKEFDENGKKLNDAHVMAAVVSLTIDIFQRICNRMSDQNSCDVMRTALQMAANILAGEDSEMMQSIDKKQQELRAKEAGNGNNSNQEEDHAE